MKKQYLVTSKWRDYYEQNLYHTKQEAIEYAKNKAYVSEDITIHYIDYDNNTMDLIQVIGTTHSHGRILIEYYPPLSDGLKYESKETTE